MLRSNGDLLYVGKASSLKKRVNSYFQKRSHMAEHILEMLTQARALDFTVTATTLEAALLEADEIKDLSPPYNIALRHRDRDLIFTSRDFREMVDDPGKSHCLGPFPRGVVEPLSQIVTLAESGKDATDECLDNWQIRSSPDSDCLQSGWNLFKERYSEELSNPSRTLFQLGARLWITRRMESENANADSDERGDSSEQPSWTPERVCHLLEGRVMIAVHWARRVRWFGLLSNSSVAWTPRRDPDRNQVLLVLQSGVVVHRETLLPTSGIPVPPAYDTSSLERLKQLDAVVIDRLRVLTTELRRLVGAGSDIRVKLSPTSTLEPEQLARLLQWV
jgi:DNA polymerase-3 subunit epsilon